ncbi:MAG: hypothetical protein K9W44_01535 [Candidatus Lokiarchaeota archaeon]|nr:hypothetical protein [Candidatus Harpocratesius repetitus]
MERTCENCANFLCCQIEKDPRGYCEADPDVLGYCSLWDGAIYKIEPCEGWKAKIA